MNDQTARQKALNCLERLLNDALSCRDGYGTGRPDAECIRSIIQSPPPFPAAPAQGDVEALRKKVPFPRDTDIHSVRANGEAIGWNACVDHLAATNRLAVTDQGVGNVPSGLKGPFSWNLDKDDQVSVVDANGSRLVVLNTHTQMPLDDLAGLEEKKIRQPRWPILCVEE